MDWAWNPYGAFSLVAMLLAWAIAVLVYLTRPERSQNRRLALALALGGAANGAYFGLRLMAADEETAFRALAVGMTFLALLPAAYLLFLAPLETPLVRFLRSKAGVLGVMAATVIVEGAWLARPDLFVSRLYYSPAVRGWQFDPGPLLERMLLPILGVVQVFGLVAAVSARRRAATPSRRQRALAFAIAFGTRDALQVVFIVLFGVLGAHVWPGFAVVFEHGIPVSDALFALLLAYGILRTQLFDIDLRIKASIRRGTIVSIFVAAFFIVEQLAQMVLQSRTNSFAVGLLGAGAMAVALAPLRKLAGRLANVAMPHVEDSDAYVRLRKLEVFREAVEGVLADGSMTPKERALLDRLRDRLKIPVGRAQALEAEILAASRGTNKGRPAGIPTA